MIGSKSAVFSLVGLMVLVNFTSFVLSECCKGGGPGFMAGVCNDGTKGTPCCAYLSCNIFCCNCDGGCRVRNGPPANHGGETEKEVFANMDRNGDGFVDKEEADAYALTNLYANHTEMLAVFDEGFKKLGKDKLTLADLRH